MNKKVLAVAVIAAMSASAAQADVKFSGGLQVEVGNIARDTGESGLAMGDVLTAGGNKGSFGASWTDGDVFGKINMNVDVVSRLLRRDMYVGMKIGGGKVMAGTFSSAYKVTGGVKIDPFLATGLQARSNGGGQGALQGSYVHAVGYRAKMGGVDVAVDFRPEMTDGTNKVPSSLGIGVKMNVGEIGLFAALATNNGLTTAGSGNSGTKFGATMKMGKIKLAAQIENTESEAWDTTGAALNGSTTATDTGSYTFVSAEMPMGGMTLAGWIGIANDKTARDGTSLALGVKKALSKKSSVYAGFRSTPTAGNADTTILGGLRTAF